jgi:hypothetical protein
VEVDLVVELDVVVLEVEVLMDVLDEVVVELVDVD